ncbi:MAG: hypothetical protein JSV88_23465 [Candidatus Aminicenantes bacterium]|nr:MAG: hypothetical protein JSV88_23465 [Candidatus Aminicenantes bacterium]
MFLVDNERNKQITISLMGKTFTMKPSQPNGHFYGEVKIPAGELKDSITYQALGVKGNRQFEGIGYLLEPGGVSVVSDIDDTIKDSQVLDKKKTVEKTFLEEFEAIPGNLFHIFIRDVTPEVDKTRRFQEAFKGIPQNKWTIFTDAAVLKNLKIR